MSAAELRDCQRNRSRDEMSSGEASVNDEPVGIIVVPPFLKYAAGPLLGPATLIGAARSAGIPVRSIDMIIDFIRSAVDPLAEGLDLPDFYGDHSKQSFLEVAERRFWDDLQSAFGRHSELSLSDIKRGWYSHSQLARATERMPDLELGRFLRTEFSRGTPCHLYGVSVMWAGQVPPALALSRIAKTEWPGVRVVWGGAHIAAIATVVGKDRDFGRWVDGFLPFHCERSFVELLSSASRGGFACKGLITPGSGMPSERPLSMTPPPNPVFTGLYKYGYPKLMLPIELSAGCPYAKCSFCTYPAVEGSYIRYPLEGLHRTLEVAVRKEAAISFKDSLLPTPMLRAIALVVGGKVEWSACTKLAPSLDSDTLSLLARNGCRTLEVGLESLNLETQRRIDKVQPVELLDRFLAGAASAGISVVINYITGFPWEDAGEADGVLQELKEHIKGFGGLVARVEQNRFNLERLSPMAAKPEKYNIRIARSWPWSSILDWRFASDAEESLQTSIMKSTGRAA